MCIDDLVLQQQHKIKKIKPVRRGKMNRRLLRNINLMYLMLDANIEKPQKAAFRVKIHLLPKSQGWS